MTASSAPGTHETTSSSASAVAVLAAPLVAAAIALIAAPLNTDTAYAMVVCRRMFGGEHLYVDMLETNPPLFFWLMAVPALASRFTQLPDDRLVGLFAATVLLVAGMTAVRLLRLDPRPPRRFAFALIAAFAAGVTVPFLAWAGQREQLAACLVLPYAVLASRTAIGAGTPRGLRIWCGVMAGVGLAIKPFFLAAWAFVELVVIGWRGLRLAWRVESATVVLVQGVYGIAIALFAWDYVTDIVPVAVATYWAYGTTLQGIVEKPRVIAIAVAGIATAALPLCLRSRSMAAAYSSVFGAATLGWLCGYVVQLKGWYYHFIPAAAYASVALVSAAFAAGDALGRLRERQPARASVALALLAFLFVGFYLTPKVEYAAGLAIENISQPYPDVLLEMSRVAEELAVGEPVYVLSTAVWPAFPLVNLSRTTWPYRYHHLWPLPALYRDAPRYRTLDEQSPLERTFFTAVVDDLTRNPPRVLIVERGTWQQGMPGTEFDLVKYFSASAEFRALFQRYRPLGQVAQWELYHLPAD